MTMVMVMVSSPDRGPSATPAQRAGNTGRQTVGSWRLSLMILMRWLVPDRRARLVISVPASAEHPVLIGWQTVLVQQNARYKGEADSGQDQHHYQYLLARGHALHEEDPAIKSAHRPVRSAKAALVGLLGRLGSGLMRWRVPD
jgi:hypothetical protein